MQILTTARSISAMQMQFFATTRKDMNSNAVRIEANAVSNSAQKRLF